MANTIKTLQGEILVAEVESVVIDNPLALVPVVKGPNLSTKVQVVGKSGIKYDLTPAIPGVLAAKIHAATLNVVAGAGHAVFDPTQVK